MTEGQLASRQNIAVRSYLDKEFRGGFGIPFLRGVVDVCHAEAGFITVGPGWEIEFSVYSIG